MKLFSVLYNNDYFEVMAHNKTQAYELVMEYFNGEKRVLNYFPVFETGEEYLKHYEGKPQNTIPLFVLFFAYLQDRNEKFPKIWKSLKPKVSKNMWELLTDEFNQRYNEYMDDLVF